MTKQELIDGLRAEAHSAEAFESTNHQMNAAMHTLCALMREAADQLEDSIPVFRENGVSGVDKPEPLAPTHLVGSIIFTEFELAINRS